MAEMGIYETMRTLRAVRRLRPDAIPDDVLHRVPRRRPGRRPAETSSRGG